MKISNSLLKDLTSVIISTPIHADVTLGKQMQESRWTLFASAIKTLTIWTTVFRFQFTKTVFQNWLKLVSSLTVSCGLHRGTTLFLHSSTILPFLSASHIQLYYVTGFIAPSEGCFFFNWSLCTRNSSSCMTEFAFLLLLKCNFFKRIKIQNFPSVNTHTHTQNLKKHKQKR